MRKNRYRIGCREDWFVFFSIFAIVFLGLVAMHGIGYDDFNVAMVTYFLLLPPLIGIIVKSLQMKQRKIGNYILLAGILFLMTETTAIAAKLEIGGNLFMSYYYYPVMVLGIAGVFIMMCAFRRIDVNA